jgi:hypothetical protein
MVESDARNAGLARRGAERDGLSQVEVRGADASLVASFADTLPADVLLLCGIFGNISDGDIERTVAAAPALCGAGATVIWTRHGGHPTSRRRCGHGSPRAASTRSPLMRSEPLR